MDSESEPKMYKWGFMHWQGHFGAGVYNALLLSIPAWLLFIATVYLLYPK